ncbi:MAG: iron ABC transporter permease [Acidobacteriota bacterium]|nr:MAG: iron ABC transporter permease [Acidobacteriota bacterium]
MTREGRVAERLGVLLVALGVVLVLVALLAVLLGGARSVGPADAWRVLIGSSPERAPEHVVRVLVFDVRLPRVTLLALAGAALAIAGAALQACLQNPLADPGLLGLSGGASLGAVVAYGSGAALAWPLSVPLAAFLGALAAIALVYVIAHAAGRPTTGILLLTGVAVGSLSSALVSVLLMAAGHHRVHEIVAWLLGSAEGRTWLHVRLALGPVLIGGVLLLSLRRLIDALALGEEQALGLGVDLVRGRALLLATVALTAGGAVSVVGPIGFVGLMVPHMVRTVSGSAARELLPAAALAGGAFLVICDLLARVVSVTVDVPVGVVTALAGVPFFLVLLHRARLRS